MVRDTSMMSSGCSISNLSSRAPSLLLLNLNVPTMTALSSPLRTSSEFALSPSKRSIESIIRDLPAPVSPVSTVKPSLNEISASSIMAKFLTDK